MTEDSRGLVAVESLNRLKSPKQPRGVTYVEAGFSDVLGHDRASPDHDMITNGNREYSSVRPDTYTIAKLGLAPEAPFFAGRPQRDLINIAP